jgi:hypothetical protein
MPEILASWSQRLGGSQFEASLGKKFTRSPSQSIKIWVLWHPLVIPATQGSTNRQNIVQVGRGIKERPYQKNT